MHCTYIVDIKCSSLCSLTASYLMPSTPKS
jgi:hypothetical protein